ncbi:MAG: NAD(P)-binding domain-containing protein [Bacteroidia bacterium]|nr:NAD(P)-binding domain-containing protein [Bacteroidia bacterium]
MTLAFIGIGNVGFALADRLQKEGHEILVAHDNAESESVRAALRGNPSLRVLPVREALPAAEVVFLATPFRAVATVLEGLHFHGKPLVDCTNPVGAGLTHGLGGTRSGAEVVQEAAPDARVVKAFSVYGVELLADSAFPTAAQRPMMPIAGNDAEAKGMVATLAETLGFAAKDVGPLAQALHLEHLALLWITMVRRDRHQPRLAWGLLEG